jgi:hypothetical protein
MRSAPKYLILKRKVWNLGGNNTLVDKEFVSVLRTDRALQQYLDSVEHEVYEVGRQISKNGKRI